MKKILITLVAMILMGQVSRAQTANSFSGVLNDSLGSPIASAVITLKDGSGKSRSELSGKSGQFIFASLPAGNYKLAISHAEFKTYLQDSVVIPAIDSVAWRVQLTRKEKTLAAVEVASVKPYISQTADKITMNVAASPTAAGSNAYDILLGAPGVIEQNNSLQFRGRSVLVLLDGRQTNLSGDDLKNYLSAMPANGIDKIEVLANPSSKYDAQGGSVINIRLAKNKNFGTNGTLTAGIGAGKFGRYNGGISLNHRYKKVNIYGSYDIQYNKQYYDNHSSRIISQDFHIVEDEYDIRTRNNHSAKIGMDLDLTKNTSMGFLAKGLLNNRDRMVENRSVMDRLSNAADSFSLVNSKGNARFISPSVNVYFRSKLDSSGKEISVNADHFGYDKNWNDEFATRYYNPKGEQHSSPYYLRDHSPANNTVSSLSLDYVQPGKKGKWEAGLKSTFTKTDNDVAWEYFDNADWKTDSGKTNRFIYRENINAAYVNLSKQVNKYSLQLGLRAEQTISQGQSPTLGQRSKKDYINLFPNVAMQYSLSPMQQFGFTYRKAIQRFGFDVVNPFVIYQSQYSYSQGNPNIKPMILHTLGFSHTWKYQLFSNLSYTYIKDALSPIYRQDDITNSIISSYDNLNTGNLFNATVTWMKSIAKGKWVTTNTAGGIYARYKSSAGKLQVQNAKVTYYYSTNNTFRLKKGWSAELTGFYYSPLASGVFEQKSLYSMNAGVAKEILKKKGNLKLAIRDIFNTQAVRYEVNYQNVNTFYRNKPESRFVNLVFTYKLGNMNVKASKVRKTGIEEERGRMGVE
jgi:hypothetical protein